jgi:hypothetical protein
MLHVDLNAADSQIAHDIKTKCHAFGQVRSVEVHRIPTTFALVEMAHPEQVREVAASFGGSAFGIHALIALR